MDLEFAENRADLIYEKEYNLNTKPLEIDLLVIKKYSDIQVANKIGKLFRKYNILEYKSPDDSLNIDAFYKAGAYAGPYKAYGETVDERRACDITVSMIREARPDGLFAYFKNHGIRMETPYRGIYYVMDSVLFTCHLTGNELYCLSVHNAMRGGKSWRLTIRKSIKSFICQKQSQRLSPSQP